MSLRNSIVIAAMGIGGVVKAQNIPSTAGLPTDPLSGVITYPPNLNASPNTTPTFYNYTRTYTPLKPMQTVPLFDLSIGQPVLISTTYGDGLGNGLMEVSRTNAFPFFDIITPKSTRLSKTSVGYLPYMGGGFNVKFEPNVYSAQKQYYANAFFLEGATAYSKGVQGTDPATGVPVTKTYAPGKAYVGQERGAISKTQIYDGTEIMKLEESSGTICKNGTYAAGSLLVKTQTDPETEAVIYTDKNNRLICKKNYLQNKTVSEYTYYVYNEMGKLTHIVPPMAAAQLVSNTCITNLSELCFTYIYDGFGNIIEKGTPGRTGKELVVYDRFQRPVLTQTPLMAAQNKWNFTVYDVLGRVAMSGTLFASYNAGYTRSWFQGQLDNRVLQPTSSVNYYFDKPINGTYPTVLSNCDIEAINYYDSYAGVAASTTYDNSFASEFLTGGIAETPAPYDYVYNKLVATKKKVLNPGNVSNNFTNSWITSVFFYDEKDRLIQTQTINPWSPANTWDVSAVQYDYINNPIYSINKHHGPGEAKSETEIRVKSIYDNLTGRLKEVWQQMDNEPWQPIQKFTYDPFGKVSHKWIGGTEEQYFTYDIRSKAIGINEVFINNPGITFTPTFTYAEKLSFEQGFTERRYDGTLTGFRWRTAGGNVNAYGYSYDDMGRMTAADFRENITPNNINPTWSKAAKDFSVADISYDANGNMLSMKQYGFDNSYQPDIIDELTYQYTANSNKLASVTDAGVTSPIDDFDNSVSNTASYQYDVNGNLAADNLKGISLSYNFQDLPLRVLKGVDEIQNIYDAGGTLLYKTITESGLPITYSYWGPFVYRNDTLLYVLHPEGRCRWVNDTGVFRYDYFIKDHIGNVRTTVTTDAASLSTYYLATHEIASAHLEEQIFDNINEVRDVRPGGTPGDVDAAELDGRDPDRRIGTSLLVHVMAGDNIDVQGYSYHEGKNELEDDIATPEDMLSALITTLSSGIGGFDGGEDGNGVDFVNALFPEFGNNYNIYESMKLANTDPSKPRAYLNYLFFDEGLNLMEGESGVIQVSGNANSWEQISLPGLPVQETGYFFVYVSNEQGQPVWFDNLGITYTKGRLLEEQNYYPHGLLSQSATTAGVDPENQYKHQGKLLQEELGMQLYDFHARQYDPQIGRFWGIDPMDQFPSGYTGMGNDPANMIDPSGMLGTLFYATGDMTPNHPAVAAKSWARQEAASAAWQELLAIEAANTHDFGSSELGPWSLAGGEGLKDGPVDIYAVERAMGDVVTVDFTYALASFQFAQIEKRAATTKAGNPNWVKNGIGLTMPKAIAEKVQKYIDDMKNASAKVEAANASIDESESHRDYVAILHDKQGAEDKGHTAMAVGSKSHGNWTYMSKDGGESNLFGDADFTINDKYATLGAVLNSKEGQRYEEALIIPISHATANNLIEDMSRQIQTYYNVVNQNCMNAVLNTMHENGLRTQYLFHFQTPSLTPNAIFENMKQYYNNQPGVIFYPSRK